MSIKILVAILSFAAYIGFAQQLGLDLAYVGCFGAEEFNAECREIVDLFQGAFIGFGIGAGRSVYDEQVAVCEAKKAQCYAQTCQQ